MQSFLSWLRICKLVGTRLALLGALMFIFVGSRNISFAQLPISTGAPSVGQKAPGFTLPDQRGRMVSLGGLLKPAGTARVKGLVLIFYRGYW